MTKKKKKEKRKKKRRSEHSSYREWEILSTTAVLFFFSFFSIFCPYKYSNHQTDQSPLEGKITPQILLGEGNVKFTIHGEPLKYKNPTETIV